MSYPTTLDDAASLPVAIDAKVAYLTAPATVSATTFTVNSTTGLPTSGVLEMPSGELVAYTGVGATSFTGLTRGYSGTVAEPYPVNTTIRIPISSAYVNNPRASVIALETKLGIGASDAAAAATGHVIKKNADGTTSWQAETSLGYTPEDVANKATDFSVINDTKYPTTKAVDDELDTRIATLIGAAPAALDTLSELSDALGDDANFATTVTNALAGKQPLDSDLTAIALLTTTAFGRALLELANAAALRAAAELGNVPNVDATNASNLSSGTIPLARMPAAISARVYNSGNISVNNATLTALTFDSERWDSDSIHSTGTNPSRLTATTAGLYSIEGAINFAVNTGGTLRSLRIRLNGATYIAINQAPPLGAGASPALVVSTQYSLAATDYVELVVYQDSGGVLNVESNGNFSPEFMMTRLSPQP
jgi:hypothetical protein